MTVAVKTSNSNEVEHRRELATAINLLILGRINSVGEFTAANATTSTVVTDTNAHSGSVVHWTPTNAAAAGIQASMYVSARGPGTFTITHNNPGASATFIYSLHG